MSINRLGTIRGRLGWTLHHAGRATSRLAARILDTEAPTRNDGLELGMTMGRHAERREAVDRVTRDVTEPGSAAWWATILPGHVDDESARRLTAGAAELAEFFPYPRYSRDVQAGIRALAVD